MRAFRRQILAAALTAALSTGVRSADKPEPHGPLVVPQAGIVAATATPPVAIDRVAAKTVIDKSAAVTTLKVTVRPRGRAPVACDVAIPLPPDGAAVTCTQTTADGKSAGLRVTRLSGKAAAVLLRNRVSGPSSTAVMEFYGRPFAVASNVVASPGGTTVEWRYRRPLSRAGSCLVYSLPKSERLSYAVGWSIDVSWKEGRPDLLYSPTHPIAMTSGAGRSSGVRVDAKAAAEPGPFRLLWKRGGEDESVDGFVIGYPPQARDDGYFLWVVKAASRPAPSSAKREITLCIDRSGSMKGRRLTQVRSVADGVLKSLKPGDTFNIISYNENVDALSKTPLANSTKSLAGARTYLNNIRPKGGADIYSALEAALQQPAPKDRLPIVLFFTDGLPIGGKLERMHKNKEIAIRNLAIKSNPHHRRVYTFGVDVQVNSPLLQSIADETGGQCSIVLPKESVVDKAAPLLKRLQSPVLTGAVVSVGGGMGKDGNSRIRSMLPERIPDLYAGDRLVIVGRYRGSDPVTLTLSGTHAGKRRSFRFAFDPKTADIEHDFLPRLWAARRTAQLVDVIRRRGASYKPSYATQTKSTDAVVARCSREILDLTARYGVVTEYTAFLAGSAAPFQARGQYSRLMSNFANRAGRSRAGFGGVNQELNGKRMRGQTRVEQRSWYYNSRMTAVQVDSVQSFPHTAMFRQNDGWVDGRLLNGRKLPAPAVSIEIGSPEYWRLADRLSSQGRQGVLALSGNLLIQDGSRTILIRRPAASGRRRGKPARPASSRMR